MSFRDELQRFVHELERESNAAADLWSWLPSHEAAEKNHGDKWLDFMPSPADVMQEAAVYFAAMKRNPDGFDEQTAEEREWFACPCGLPARPRDKEEL